MTLRHYSRTRTWGERIFFALKLLAGAVLLAAIAAVVNAQFSPGSTNTDAPAPAPDLTAQSTEAVPTPTLAPAVAFTIGQQAEVYGTGNCLNVRSGPDTVSPVLACIADGTTLTVTGGPVDGAGHRWWKVGEYEGWAAEGYLRQRMDSAGAGGGVTRN